MTEKILHDIKRTEQKAREILENAEKDKQKLIEKARHDSLRLLREGEEKSEKEKQSIMDSGMKAIRIQKEKIIAEGKKQVSETEKKAKTEKAVKYVMDQFEKQIS